MSPVRISVGDSANAAASHGRPRSTFDSSHTASSAIAPKPTALTSRKIVSSSLTSSSALRSPTARSARASVSGLPLSVWVSHAAPYAQ